MANLKQSKKRIRRDQNRRVINKNILSSVKTFIKKFLKSIETKESDLNSKYKILVSKIDSSVSKNVIKKRKADRLKKRLNNKLKLC